MVADTVLEHARTVSCSFFARSLGTEAWASHVGIGFSFGGSHIPYKLDRWNHFQVGVTITIGPRFYTSRQEATDVTHRDCCNVDAGGRCHILPSKLN
ncbi:hypothetical protein SAY87_002224 [Trapa incisa]|uniref:Uncharacterized protein n=1 Tax=Trapa incisa TaxID=236973 RepID=A0AAN7JWM1_9MYRT|nr:hypothetical protein SAY87_002224 [Trapa incisa]